MTADNLTFQWENDSNTSFLSLTLAAGVEVNNFQMNMLAQNKIPYLLPVSRYQRNGVTRLSYNVTGTMRLTDVWDCMTSEQMANLLWSLSNCYKELPQYNLPVQGLLTDEKYVFLSWDENLTQDENLTPYFVFLPLREDGDNPDGLSDFLRSLVEHSHIVDADEQFSRRIRDIANQDNLTLERFRQNVSELLPAPVTPPPPVEIEPPLGEPEPTKPKNDGRRRTTKRNGRKRNRAKSKSKAAPSQNRTFFFAAQGVFLVLLTLVGRAGAFFTEEGAFAPFQLFAVLLCFAVAEYFLYKKLFLSASASQSSKSKSKPEAIEPYYPSGHVMPNGILSPEEEENFFSDMDAKPDERSNIEPERPVLENLDNVPRLSYQENGVEKAIPLLDSLTRVGRYRNMDFRLSDKSIDMAHAFFYRENGRFFVEDRQSGTGTFLNGSPERIAILDKVEIRPGDTIRLGDVTLKFQI